MRLIILPHLLPPHIQCESCRYATPEPQITEQMNNDPGDRYVAFTDHLTFRQNLALWFGLISYRGEGAWADEGGKSPHKDLR